MARTDGECLWCDRAWAILGLMAGGAIMYMAVDLLTGGYVTRSLTRTARLASVSNLPVGDSDAG